MSRGALDTTFSQRNPWVNAYGPGQGQTVQNQLGQQANKNPVSTNFLRTRLEIMIAESLTISTDGFDGAIPHLTSRTLIDYTEFGAAKGSPYTVLHSGMGSN